MKKYLSILLALALVLSLAACGTDDPASSDLPDPDVEGSGGELDVDDGSTPTDINAATPAPTPDSRPAAAGDAEGVRCVDNKGQPADLPCAQGCEV